MRKPLAPLEALQADAASAAARQVDLDATLAEWVAAAQLSCELAARYGALNEPPPGLGDELTRVTLLAVAQQRPTMVHDGQDAPSSDLAMVAERLRVHAEAMEQRGCFELALTTVAAVCRLTARADAIAHALATLHLGRIARQMNALDAAEDAYASAIARALHLREPPIAARGHIGLALLADMRGNLPEAASHYEQARQLAVPNAGAYRQALQGLMSLAVTRNDLGEALVLGWTIYDASTDDPTTQRIALGELSIVALKAGFPAQARAGFKVVLDGPLPSRNRLIMLGGDVRAAACLGLVDDVQRLAVAIEREAAECHAHNERTMTFVHLAEAFHRVGDEARAYATLDVARTLAAQYRFHEYSFAADALEQSWTRAEGAPTSVWMGDTDDVPSTIERLAALR